MIQVTVGNNVKRDRVIVEETATLRKVLEDAEIPYANGGAIHLDGCTLSPGDLDKTFEQLGITERCYLLQVTKADGASF